MNDPAPVMRNLRHWTLHVSLGASGSFSFAAATEWHNPQAVTGMLVGIVAYITIYTSVGSSRWFRRNVPPDSLHARALLYGTRLRSFLGVQGALVMLVSSFTPPGGLRLLLTFFGLPSLLDMLAGIVAVNFLQWLGKTPVARSFRILVAGPDAHHRAQSFLVGDINSFLPTVLITLTTGLFITLTLLLLFSVCLAVLRKRTQHTFPCAA